MFLGDGEHRRAAFLRHQPSRGILEIRNRVEQLDAPPRGHLAQRLRHDPLIVLLHAHQLRAACEERGRAANVGGQLNGHDIARIEQRVRDEIERLLRSGGNDHVALRALDAARCRRSRRSTRKSRGSPARRPVLQRHGAPLTNHLLRHRRNPLRRKRIRIRHPTRERDDVRIVDQLRKTPRMRGGAGRSGRLERKRSYECGRSLERAVRKVSKSQSLKRPGAGHHLFDFETLRPCATHRHSVTNAVRTPDTTRSRGREDELSSEPKRRIGANEK